MTREVEKALAGVRVLVCVARADGQVSDEERAALEGALGRLPGAPSVDALLGQHISLDEQLHVLGEGDERKLVYDAAVVLAHADGAPADAELAVLERIRPPEAEPSFLAQVIGETKDTFFPGSIAPIHDPEQRAVEIQEDTLKYAVLSGVLGAMPIPGVAIVTDIAVVGLQVKLVRDVGQYWGHALDEKAARSLVASVLGSAGIRIAINNLARFVPGWGSVFGAATSFATTLAAGKMANAYFESGRTMNAEALRATYEQGLSEGKAAYATHAGRVEAAKAAHAQEIAGLAAELEAGRIGRDEYERRLAELR